jgi:hypothetical protein
MVGAENGKAVAKIHVMVTETTQDGLASPTSLTGPTCAVRTSDGPEHQNEHDEPRRHECHLDPQLVRDGGARQRNRNNHKYANAGLVAAIS